jgi:hypothetical protein
MLNYSYIWDIFYVEVDDVDKHMVYLTHVSWAKLIGLPKIIYFF